jgi:hypothetical protein
VIFVKHQPFSLTETLPVTVTEPERSNFPICSLVARRSLGDASNILPAVPRHEDYLLPRRLTFLLCDRLRVGAYGRYT